MELMSLRLNGHLWVDKNLTLIQLCTSWTMQVRWAEGWGPKMWLERKSGPWWKPWLGVFQEKKPEAWWCQLLKSPRQVAKASPPAKPLSFWARVAPDDSLLCCFLGSAWGEVEICWPLTRVHQQPITDRNTEDPWFTNYPEAFDFLTLLGRSRNLLTTTFKYHERYQEFNWTCAVSCGAGAPGQCRRGSRGYRNLQNECKATGNHVRVSRPWKGLSCASLWRRWNFAGWLLRNQYFTGCFLAAWVGGENGLTFLKTMYVNLKSNNRELVE